MREEIESKGITVVVVNDWGDVCDAATITRHSYCTIRDDDPIPTNLENTSDDAMNTTRLEYSASSDDEIAYVMFTSGNDTCTQSHSLTLSPHTRISYAYTSHTLSYTVVPHTHYFHTHSIALTPSHIVSPSYTT